MAVKVALCPAQIVGLFAVIIGSGVTFTVELVDAEQPEAVPVTVYVVVLAGVTEIEVVLAPVLQL